MPKQSIKSIIIEHKINEVIREIQFIEDVEFPAQDIHEKVDEMLDELLDDVVAIYSCRRGDELQVPKSIQWRNNVLCSFDDGRFLQMLRVTKSQFTRLVNLIQDDICFCNPNALQIPVDLQLAIVLYRLGSSGGSASVRKISTIFGVGDGGTLAKLTQRVFGAILRRLPDFIYWPDAAERQKLVEETFHELPYCIGYIDGSEIKLAEKPRSNHEVYFSRQRIYSMKLQVVCDHKLRIRDAVVGNPGSFHDSKVFRNSEIAKNNYRFFRGYQWIAGDSAYPLLNYLITPYRSNSHLMDVDKQTRFNKRHSRYRVRIENCFGLLKEKFCSLKEMRVRINNAERQEFFCKWVLVCCVLHNILLQDHDIEQNVSSNIDIVEVQGVATRIDAPTAELKRQALYNLMFE